MKLWGKIFLLCMVVYIITLGITSFVIIEYSFVTAMEIELERGLKEEKQVNSVINSYVASRLDQALLEQKSDIDVFSPGLDISSEDLMQRKLINEYLQLMGGRSFYIAITDYEGNTIIENFNIMDHLDRKEIQSAAKGQKNYIIRNVLGGQYLFVTNKLNDKMIISVIKDISYIYRQKRSSYRFFLNALIGGILLMSVIVPIGSMYITKPIKRLIDGAIKISKGDYSSRIDIKGMDEIGTLAFQYNIMASKIEEKVCELNKTNDNKQKFIDNLVHELRTPMTSVIGYSEFLMSTRYDEEVFYKGLKYINSEGKRVLDFSNRLMDMIYLRQYGLVLKTGNLLLLIEEVAEVMMIKLQDKGIKLELQCEDMTLEFDWELIKSVLVNLIDNASNASKEGDTIIIGTKQSPDKSIFVKDQGKGIPKEELDKVAEPFFRVDKARNRKYGGAGLGLSICKEIVNLHNAQFNIYSDIDKGTTVEIRF